MESSAVPTPPRGPGQIARAVAILEVVARRGSSTAHEIADETGIPLPSVYRIAHELIDLDYLVHLRTEGRFGLGYQLHRLAVGLHDDLGISPDVRLELRKLHKDVGMASYLAIHRGARFVVVAVADSPNHPKIAPMGFGFHEDPHATAFGKLGLSSLDERALAPFLTHLRPLTPATITDPEVLRSQLQEIALRGVAWEHNEFQVGVECMAVAMRAGDGTLLGSVALSAPLGSYSGRTRQIEDRVRACAARVGHIMRMGRHDQG